VVSESDHGGEDRWVGPWASRARRRGSTSTGRGTEDGTSAATGRADPAVVRRRGGPGAFAIADRRLPTGRATVGAALIVIAAAGVFVAHRAANEPPSTDYVVATRHVPAGHVLEADDLGALAIDLPAGVSAIPAAQATDLIGRASARPLDELDIVRPGDVLDDNRFGTAGSVELGVTLEAGQALGGALATGDVVDVLSTDPDGTGTELLAPGARVVAVSGSDGDEVIGASSTLAIRLSVADAAAAVAVVDAAVRSTVTLVMPSPIEAPHEAAADG